MQWLCRPRAVQPFTSTLRFRTVEIGHVYDILRLLDLAKTRKTFPRSAPDPCQAVGFKTAVKQTPVFYFHEIVHEFGFSSLKHVSKAVLSSGLCQAGIVFNSQVTGSALGGFSGTTGRGQSSARFPVFFLSFFRTIWGSTRPFTVALWFSTSVNTDSTPVQ